MSDKVQRRIPLYKNGVPIIYHTFNGEPIAPKLEIVKKKHGLITRKSLKRASTKGEYEFVAEVLGYHIDTKRFKDADNLVKSVENKWRRFIFEGLKSEQLVKYNLHFTNCTDSISENIYKNIPKKVLVNIAMILSCK